MKLELTGPQISKISKAVNAAYGGFPYSIELLNKAVKSSFPDRSVFDYVVVHYPFQLQVDELLGRANGEGWLPSLLGVLSQDRPDQLQKIVHTALSTASARDLLDLATGDASGESTIKLEGILPGSAIVKSQTLRRRIQCVCRVDYADFSPPGYGTGFLIAPDLVLTNWHVVRRVLEAPDHARMDVAAQLRFRFDLLNSADAVDNKGRVCRAKQDNGIPILWSRPAAGIELKSGKGEPDMTALDYALIRLQEHVGGDVLENGNERQLRGHIAIPHAQPPILNSALMVLQHPLRGELQFAIGTVIGPNETGSRIKHNAATQGGSSGSPVFDVSLAPVALHNGTRAGTELAGKPYNTAVPLTLISADIKSALSTEMLPE